MTSRLPACSPTPSAARPSSFLLRSPRETSSTRPLSPSDAIFVPLVRVTRVLPQMGLENMLGALMSYQSLDAKGSMIFFFDPFFPLVRRLFLPTAIFASLPCHTSP